MTEGRVSGDSSPEDGATTHAGAAAAEPVAVAGAAGLVAPRELELKYSVPDPRAMREWLESGWGGAIAAAQMDPERVSSVEDRYFDTARGALARAGFGARLRRVEDGATSLTVKSISRDRPPVGNAASGPGPGAVALAALAQRVEVEGPATDRLDPMDWPSSPARELVDELRGAARLRLLFTVRQRRHSRQVSLPEGRVEVTLDEVTVLHGVRSVGSFCALEVEAADGRVAALARLAGLLEASGLVGPEPRSKEEIARKMVSDAGAHPARRLPRVPKVPGISTSDPLPAAGRKVLRMHLARMLSFEAGTRSGADIEDLHRMRVATRRMRGAWRVFEGAYRPRLQRRYVRELREAAAALGRVRDMDVLLDGLAAYERSLPDEGRVALAPLRSDWARQREEARQGLMAYLDSRRYRDFVEDYLDFVETPGAGERPPLPGEPDLVRDTAGSRILAAFERVRAYQAAIAWADMTTLHALRIEGKRLRYTLEFFAEVLPATAGRLIGTVTAMQDHLGLMNDAHVAAGLARAWLRANATRVSATSAEAVGLYLAAREDEERRLRRSFMPLWRRITGRGFRRALALAVAAIE